jgi:hypothetical protein
MFVVPGDRRSERGIVFRVSETGGLRRPRPSF